PSKERDDEVNEHLVLARNPTEAFLLRNPSRPVLRQTHKLVEKLGRVQPLWLRRWKQRQGVVLRTFNSRCHHIICKLQHRIGTDSRESWRIGSEYPGGENLGTRQHSPPHTSGVLQVPAVHIIELFEVLVFAGNLANSHNLIAANPQK